MASWFSWWCIGTVTAVAVVVGVTASNTSCPTWFYYDNSTQQCKCGFLLKCTSDSQVEIEDGLCATYAGEGSRYFIGPCPFRHTVNNTDSVHSEMPRDPALLDDFMCGHYNRRGLLCGRCIAGYGPTGHVLDLTCANCSGLPEHYAVTLYLVLQLIPVTVFFICVTIFNINITSGPLFAYIVFSQIFLVALKQNLYIYEYIHANVSMHFQVMLKISVAKISVAIYQIWSLDFVLPVIPPFCVSQRLSELHIQLLRFVPTIFLILLVIIIFVLMELHARNFRVIHTLWKPFSIILDKTAITGVTNNSVIHAFASFIFLANSYVFTNFMNVLGEVNIYREDGSVYKHSLLLDPTLKQYHFNHILFITVSSVPLFIFTLLPSLLYIIYPTRIYEYLSRCISARKRLAITAFTEALQACFKDGLNGTRDYRALPGLIPVFLLIYAVSNEILITGFGWSPAVSSAFFTMFTGCVFLYLQPFKQAIGNISIGFHFMLLSILSLIQHWWLHESESTETLVLALVMISLLPHVLVCTWAGYMLVQCIMRRCGCWHSDQCDCRVKLPSSVSECLRRRQDGGYQELE